MASPKEAFERVKIALLKTAPAYYNLLSYIRVVYIDSYGHTDAETDGKVIYLYKKWLEEPLDKQYGTIKHELTHIFYRHVLRAKCLAEKYGKQIWPVVNLAADGIVNVRIVSDVPGLGKFFRADWIAKRLGYSSTDVFWKKTLEEIVEDYVQNSISSSSGKDISDSEFQGKSGQDLRGDSPNYSSGSFQVLQEGDDDIQKEINSAELEKKLVTAIVRSVIAAKQIGLRIGSVEREVYKELLEPKIDWASVLNQMIKSHVMNVVVETWARPNRRHEYAPGVYAYAQPTVYVLDDESGSISFKERQRFYSEIAGMLDYVKKVKLIVWDTEVRHVFEINDVNELKKIRTRAGGGTVFMSALRYLVDKEEVQPWDVVVVLTDGYWADDENEVVRYLDMISGKKILVTVGKIHNGFDEVLKIEV